MMTPSIGRRRPRTFRRAPHADDAHRAQVSRSGDPWSIRRTRAQPGREPTRAAQLWNTISGDLIVSERSALRVPSRCTSASAARNFAQVDRRRRAPAQRREFERDRQSPAVGDAPPLALAATASPKSSSHPVPPRHARRQRQRRGPDHDRRPRTAETSGIPGVTELGTLSTRRRSRGARRRVHHHLRRSRLTDRPATPFVNETGQAQRPHLPPWRRSAPTRGNLPPATT